MWSHVNQINLQKWVWPVHIQAPVNTVAKTFVFVSQAELGINDIYQKQLWEQPEDQIVEKCMQKCPL